MPKVRRRVTSPKRVQHLLRRSTDYPDVESGMDTLTARFKALQDGDSMYPWSNTVLRIEMGKRKWVAKQHITQ